MKVESCLKLGTDKFGHTIYDEAEVLRLRNSGLGMRKIHNQTNIPKTTLHRIFKRNNIQTFPYQTKRWGNAFRIKERKRLVAQIFKRGSEARIITAKVIRNIRLGTKLGEALENCGACPEIAIRWLKKTKSYDAIKWRCQKNNKTKGLSQEERLISIKSKKEAEKILNRETRSKTAWLIKKLKNGIPVETAIREAGIKKHMAWRWLYKTKAYNILRKKLKINSKWGFQILKQRENGVISLRFAKEKHMNELAIKEIEKRHPSKTITKEENVYETTSNRGLLADFLVKEEAHIYELKQRCDAGSAKEAIGQIFIYQMLGFRVSLILPNDVIIPKYFIEALDKMKAELILI
jgi:hypothetical protein